MTEMKKLAVCVAMALGVQSAAQAEDYQLEIGGVVEVEAGYSNPENGDSESDIVVATVELGIAAEINEQLSAEVVALYEDDGDEELDIDVAQFTYAFGASPFSLTVGQLYVPFGVYETGLVSDPLTLEVGETRESAFALGFENEVLNGSFYVFNGDVNENGDNSIDQWGLSFGVGTEVITAQLDYINSIGDSDALQDTLAETDVSEYVAGLSASVVANFGAVSLIGEVTTALDEFEDEALAGAEPSATNLEVNFATELFGKEATIALAYQTTDEALGLELPESRALIGLGLGLNDNLGLGIEYSKDEDYDQNEGGSGESVDNFVVQLALEF